MWPLNVVTILLNGERSSDALKIDWQVLNTKLGSSKIQGKGF